MEEAIAHKLVDTVGIEPTSNIRLIDSESQALGTALVTVLSSTSSVD